MRGPRVEHSPSASFIPDPPIAEGKVTRAWEAKLCFPSSAPWTEGVRTGAEMGGRRQEGAQGRKWPRGSL